MRASVSSNQHRRRGIFFLLFLQVVILAGCQKKEPDSGTVGGRPEEEIERPSVLFVCTEDGESSNQYSLSDEGTYEFVAQDSNTEDCIPSQDFQDKYVPNPNSTASDDDPDSENEANAPATARPLAVTSPTLDETSPLTRALPYLPTFTNTNFSQLTPSCNPAATFYSVNHTQNQLTHFGTCPYRRIGTIPLYSRPLQVMFTPDAKLLLATNFDGAISFVDPSTDKVVNTLMTPGMNPSGIAITPDGATAYVTNYSNSQPGLMIINIANRSMTGLITTPGYPKSVFLTPDGTQAWVTSIDSSTIYIVDLFTQTVTTTLNMPGYAHTGLAFNPTGTLAYVAVQPSNLLVIDTATYDTVANITIGPFPNDVIVNRTGTAVYVSGYDANGTLSAVDATTNKLTGTIQAGSPASHMILFPGAP